MHRRIVILGAGGFLGGWLTKRLAESGEFILKPLSRQQCDLLDPEIMEEALDDLSRDDVVILSSAVVRLRENSFDAMMKNIRMIENVARFLSCKPVRQLIFLSSTDVYGPFASNTLISEDLPINPQDYYGISKFSCESLLRSQCSAQNIHFCVLRLSGVYGPGGEDGKSNVIKMIQSGLHQGQIRITGDGTNLRDFIWVDDLYRIVHKAVSLNLNQTLNVATGKSLSIVEIAHMIRKLLPNITIHSNGDSLERERQMRFDTTRFQQTFPNFQFTTLEEGIELYLKHLEIAGFSSVS